jgi:hypothetical protein
MRAAISARCDIAPIGALLGQPFFMVAARRIGGHCFCGSKVSARGSDQGRGHPLAVSAFRSRAACRLSRAGSNGQDRIVFQYSL